MGILRMGFTVIAVIFFVTVGDSRAQSPSPEEKGLEIAKEADRRLSGFGDCQEIFTMTLRDDRGRSRVRRMRILTLEREDDGDWFLSIFDEPADVKGTAMLTYSHTHTDDDQWLYLPALKRVKRISSKKKSGSFMGSEFSFEDFSSMEIEKYKYKYLRNEPCGDLDCFVSEWIPTYAYSGYTRMMVWHDLAEYRIQRVDYYDRKNKLLKTLLVKGYQLFDEKYWRAMHWIMENHQTKRSTTLEYSEYRFGVGLTERDFDQAALKRAK
ncbi:MAG: outer membrane lipoprotein-sorting protein [Desulfatitalea sp.]|nr:outer membrane lipoprotein-sorting protein [Desulfatitalea sp.]